MSKDEFKTRGRGSKGSKGGSGKKMDDFTRYLFTASTHNYLLFFTNKGQVYQLRGWQVPEATRTAKGTAVINLLQLSPGEKITTVINITGFEEGNYLFMATNRGIVKKTKLTEFTNVRRSGLRGISLGEDEELISVKLTDGNSEIFMATRNGLAIHFHERDVRETGRPSHGVRGMTLHASDTLISMDTVKADEDCDLLTVTDQGMGKRTKHSLYSCQTRGGKGRINYNLNSKTGLVAGMVVVREDDELYTTTANGIIMRTRVKGISQIGRNTQGVRVVSLKDGDKITSIAALAPEEDGEE